MEDEKQQIIRKRQEMLKKMGVPGAGKMTNESIVAGGANSSMAQKLAAIKNGAAKSELSKYINATSKSAPSAGFQGIPTPKQSKSNQEVKPEYKQELADFGAPSANSHELSAIDSMFGGDGPIRMSGNQGISQNPMNMELDINSIDMPSFNPHAALQQKAKINQNNNPSPYLKFASTTQPVQNEQFVEVNNPLAQQPQFNVQQLQVMMETIAKGIAEKTIKSVLNEYSEQQKNKNYFEYYNKEKSIIKTPDGKYYRLTQVELKKKQ